MTEEEWLTPAPDNPATATIEILMNCLLESGPGERKLRLFAHAICQPLAPLLDDERSRMALTALESYADGRCSVADLESHCGLATNAFDTVAASLGGVWEASARSDPRFHAAEAIALATEPRDLFAAPGYTGSSIGFASWKAIVAAGLSVPGNENEGADTEPGSQAEALRQIRLLREIFGNPFRPVPFDPAWRTSTVLALAQGIYEERAFDRLPILADALQDAGCDNEDLLNHLRDANAPHVRGCWALDRVLGKESADRGVNNF